ncbi:MAG: hypothetical protein RIT04_176 [Candidatus Parcubacteria bacterium]|jgi:hypothetical protein
MKKDIVLLIFILLIVFGFIGYISYSKNRNLPPVDTSILYTNTEYGFTFTLPINWKDHSILKEMWIGNPLSNTSAQSGTKLLIRNPKWTSSEPYEDLPILIFTISQWNSYEAEGFSVGAAPIRAIELGRNTKYVFALPARWDFDYSTDYQQAQEIIAGKPLHPFNN